METKDYLALYTGMGLCPIPVSNDKRPLISSWQHLASSDLKLTLDLFEKFDNPNIGLVMGPKSKMFALDIDRKGGKDGLEAILKAYPEAKFSKTTLKAKTPNNGIHVFYEWDNNIPLTSHVNALSGVDLKGARSFVMAEPSKILVDGQWKQYEFNDIALAPAPIPDWLKNLSSKVLTKKIARFDPTQIMHGVHESDRDNSLFRYCCHLRGLGIEYSLAVGFIRQAAALCIPPFPEQIAVEKIQRAYDKI